MDYEEFIKYFTHEISYNLKMLGVTWRASPVIGEGKEGAMAVIRGGGYADLPPISIYEYYQRFLQGTLWGVAAREATQEYFDDKITRSALEDMGVFAPDMVLPTFANVKENAERLEQIPHIRFEDLAVVLQVAYQSLGGINLNMTVTDDILEEWELSFDELYQRSLDNPRNIESVQMVELYKMLDEMASYEGAAKNLPLFYVITNTGQYLGAASILYKEKMRELADSLGEDILLVPMSIDQFIAMPLLDSSGVRYIANVLRESNGTMPLSENLYHYNCRTEQFRMISDVPKETKKRGRYGAIIWQVDMQQY